jgi:hypothetical protein
MATYSVTVLSPRIVITNYRPSPVYTWTPQQLASSQSAMRAAGFLTTVRRVSYAPVLRHHYFAPFYGPGFFGYSYSPFRRW